VAASANNAAVSTSGLLANTPVAAIERTVLLNTVSPMLLIKADWCGANINWLKNLLYFLVMAIFILYLP
jgi:hypothetical protein